MPLRIATMLFVVVHAANPCHATVTETYNKSQWQQAVRTWSTVDFTGWEPFTIITDQYSKLGVTFTDGNDTTHLSTGAYPNDSWGLRSQEGFGLGQITCQFDRDMHWFAVDHPTRIVIHLFRHGTLIYSSSPFSENISRFAGLISTDPFDKAVIQRTADTVVNIDDLFFGAPVPAPGALSAVGAMLLLVRRSRR